MVKKFLVLNLLFGIFFVPIHSFSQDNSKKWKRDQKIIEGLLSEDLSQPQYPLVYPFSYASPECEEAKKIVRERCNQFRQTITCGKKYKKTKKTSCTKPKDCVEARKGNVRYEQASSFFLLDCK